MRLNFPALVLALIFLTISHTNSAQAFKDVPKGHWAEPAVKKITNDYKIMSGYPNNTFVGSNTVNRYEMAVMLSKLLDSFEKELDKDREDLASLLEVMELFQSEIKVLKDEIKKRDLKIDELNRYLDGFSGENERLRKDIMLLKQDYDVRMAKKVEAAKPPPEKKKKKGFWIFGRKKDKETVKESYPQAQQPSTMNREVMPPPAPPQYEY